MLHKKISVNIEIPGSFNSITVLEFFPKKEKKNMYMNISRIHHDVCPSLRFSQQGAWFLKMSKAVAFKSCRTFRLRSIFMHLLHNMINDCNLWAKLGIHELAMGKWYFVTKIFLTLLWEEIVLVTKKNVWN